MHQKSLEEPIWHCINIPVNFISLSNYEIGDTTNPLQFANVITGKTKTLELKELRVNDAIIRLLSPGLDPEHVHRDQDQIPTSFLDPRTSWIAQRTCKKIIHRKDPDLSTLNNIYIFKILDAPKRAGMVLDHPTGTVITYRRPWGRPTSQ